MDCHLNTRLHYEIICKTVQQSGMQLKTNTYTGQKWPLQITTKISKEIRRFERLPTAIGAIPKIADDRVRISEDFQKFPKVYKKGKYFGDFKLH